MMKENNYLLRLRVGDTAVLHVEILEVIGDKWFRFQSLRGSFSPPLVLQSVIKEVISRPIRVGDTVHKIDDVLPDFHYTVLAVHGSDTPLILPYGPTRRWAVCSHGDDIPCVFNVSELECVD